mgnify:CR=1 FL=1
MNGERKTERAIHDEAKAARQTLIATTGVPTPAQVLEGHVLDMCIALQRLEIELALLRMELRRRASSEPDREFQTLKQFATGGPISKYPEHQPNHAVMGESHTKARSLEGGAA